MMGARTSGILADALSLPAEERAGLAVELLASLDGEPDPDAEQAWVEEITARAQRARSGQSVGLEAEAVHAQARRILEGK
jgi:hypothetical protein